MGQFGQREPRRSAAGATVVAPVARRRIVVGPANDPAEAEADRLAAAALARASAAGPMFASSGTRIRRAAASSAAPVVGAEGGSLDGDIAGKIAGARTGGAALEAGVRQQMESGFGADFRAVRIHDDQRSDELNRQLSAEAFTYGSDVFFRAGGYQPGSSAGQHLLAHELAHTVQQGSAAVHRRTAEPVVRRTLTWTNTDWSEASRMSVSGGASLTGVFFLTGRGGETIVVKAAAGGARSQLAAEMMGASEAPGLQQRTLLLASKEGRTMLKEMHRLASKFRRMNKTAKGENPLKTKMASQLESGNFDCVTVMPGASNLSNLEDLHGNAEFDVVFQRMIAGSFFGDLGRIHAADMIMGNEDRLDRMNDKNIFVDMLSGGSVGLDLDLNAATFDQVTTDKTEGKKSRAGGQFGASLAGNNYTDFVAFSLFGSTSRKQVTGVGKTITAPMAMRGGKMATADSSKAADPAKAAGVFDEFVHRMIDRAEQAGAAHEQTLRNQDWAVPKQQFLAGVTHGLQQLEAKKDRIGQRAGTLKGHFGDDSFLDPMVFKIRLTFAALLREGYDQKHAVKLCELYAEHSRNGGTDDAFMAWAQDEYVRRWGPKGATGVGSKYGAHKVKVSRPRLANAFG